MKKSNIIGAIIFMCISIYVIAETFTFKKFKNVPVGPEFFPRWLGIGLFVCSVVLLYQSIRSHSTEKAPTISIFDKGIQRMLVGATITIIYTALWNRVGFIILTPIFLFVMMYILKIRKYAFMIGISVAMTLVIFGIFKYILSIELPLGLLG